MQAKTKNRITIVLTVLLFTSPVVVAYLLSSGLINYEPDSTKNKGHFISPLVKVADHTEADWTASLMGHWTLVYRLPEVCRAQCAAYEDELQRYRLSLGHRADKLNLLLLADGFDSEAPDRYPQVKKVAIGGDNKLKAVLDDLSKVSLQQGKGLYVVAPEGYLMMSFTADNTSSEIISDLSLLVKRKGD